ncbi:hypothetical protein AB0E59_17455 [Lentzea sp. NPDC034063]|uniref:hypothetical protein n=1 Tax=unclassified Lentzea TaxID=2643253 RepID=UPI0033E22CA5
MSEPIERVAVQVDRLCWTGILLGLAFTMTNVQQFAAAGAPVWSLTWFAAWLLDPMVSLVLLAILRAEQVTARRGVRLGGWVRAAKWFTLGATYVMNTWSAFVAGSAALVVLHSVPPLVVFVAAEAVTELRDKLGAVEDGARVPRTSFAEYLAVARKTKKAGEKVSPAWVREATGCSRGLSSKLAAALNEDRR